MYATTCTADNLDILQQHRAISYLHTSCEEHTRQAGHKNHSHHTGQSSWRRMHTTMQQYVGFNLDSYLPIALTLCVSVAVLVVMIPAGIIFATKNSTDTQWVNMPKH